MSISSIVSMFHVSFPQGEGQQTLEEGVSKKAKNSDLVVLVFQNHSNALANYTSKHHLELFMICLHVIQFHVTIKKSNILYTLLPNACCLLCCCLCYWLLRITACLLYGSHKSKHSVSRALGPPSLCWSHCPGAPELLCAAGWACLPAITEGLKWHREMHQHLSNPRTKWPRLPGSLSTTWEISKSPLGSVIRWDGKGSISTALQAGTDVQILEIFFLHSSG